MQSNEATEEAADQPKRFRVVEYPHGCHTVLIAVTAVDLEVRLRANGIEQLIRKLQADPASKKHEEAMV